MMQIFATSKMEIFAAIVKAFSMLLLINILHVIEWLLINILHVIEWLINYAVTPIS